MPPLRHQSWLNFCWFLYPCPPYCLVSGQVSHIFLGLSSILPNRMNYFYPFLSKFVIFGFCRVYFLMFVFSVLWNFMSFPFIFYSCRLFCLVSFYLLRIYCFCLLRDRYVLLCVFFYCFGFLFNDYYVIIKWAVYFGKK